jgi:membrane protease YdiL (CAAX protease family)
MNMSTTYLLFPYLTLGLLIAGLFMIRSRILLSILLAAQIVFAFLHGLIDPLGLLFVASFWGLCALHWQTLSRFERFNSERFSALRIFFIATIAIAFASHMIPGFHNLRLFNGVSLSSTAAPFTMYLNFDKTIAAVIIALVGGFFIQQKNTFGFKTLRDTVVIAGLCLSLLAPIAILSGYVHYEPKFPDTFWLWAFNNLYFVCFAEEVIFRGLIQNQLMKMADRWNVSPYIPIIISAILFAVALPGHRQGGLMFMGFVILSGLFYGYAYHRTKRLESAILVHFMVNLAHFLLFSYPMVAR